MSCWDKMDLFHNPKCRLLGMLCLTFIFFFVEIIIGYLTNSTALIADSFHMLSDVVALVIAYVSVRMSPKKWSKNTFGWARAEVLGALINAVFLLALCFSILIEALKRIIDPENLHNPMLILTVGVIGLIINLIGLFILRDRGHSHGGHSHGGNVQIKAKEYEFIQNGEIIKSSTSPDKQNSGNSKSTKVYSNSSSNMNMRGVFLHVLADALGSIIVIISAFIVQYSNWSYNIYVDPALSIIMVIIITYSTLPLLIESAMILLQTVPTHIKIDSLQRKLLEKIDGVLAVHEFHVWQLAGDRIIASAHIRCRNLHDYMRIAERVKEFFHNEGIHSTTIQPEFVESDDTYANDSEGHFSDLNISRNSLPRYWLADANCALDCPPGTLGKGSCLPNTCCGPQQKRSPIFDEIAIGKAGSTQITRRNPGKRSLEAPSETIQLNDKLDLEVIHVDSSKLDTINKTNYIDNTGLISSSSSSSDVDKENFNVSTSDGTGNTKTIM